MALPVRRITRCSLAKPNSYRTPNRLLAYHPRTFAGRQLCVPNIDLPVRYQHWLRAEKNLSNTRICILQSVPHVESKGIFLYSHGLTSRYAHQMRLLETIYQAGYDVVAYDLPGHGSSEKADGQTNGSIRDADQLLAVTAGMVDYALQHYPNRKLILSGWSLGGLLASLYMQQHPGVVTASVQLAPAVGNLSLRGLIHLLRGADPSLWIGDPEMQKVIRNDPSFFNHAPDSLIAAVQALWSFLDAKEFKTPTLALLAGREKIINNREVRSYFREATFRNHVAIEVKDVALSLHDLANDVASETVLAEILKYLSKH